MSAIDCASPTGEPADDSRYVLVCDRPSAQRAKLIAAPRQQCSVARANAEALREPTCDHPRVKNIDDDGQSSGLTGECIKIVNDEIQCVRSSLQPAGDPIQGGMID